MAQLCFLCVQSLPLGFVLLTEATSTLLLFFVNFISSPMFPPVVFTSLEPSENTILKWKCNSVDLSSTCEERGETVADVAEVAFENLVV